MLHDHGWLAASLAIERGMIGTDRLIQAGVLYEREGGRRPLLSILTESGWLDADSASLLEAAADRLVASTAAGPTATASTERHADDPSAPTVDLGDSTAPWSFDDPAAPSSRTSPPSVRYTRQFIHATGGLGRVWLARDEWLGRNVALKDLRPDRADTPGMRDRFLQEARVTSALEHPSIVPLYDLVSAGKESKSDFYTMRFVSGRTLASATRDYHQKKAAGGRSTMDLVALLESFVAVCRAVAFAHQRDVLHRDLKGENVILGDFGEVFLLDWGLARIEAAADSHASRKQTPEGTPPFMSPELADGGPSTRASDIYGLGAILYTLLAGRAPYKADTPSRVLDLVRGSPPPRPRDIDPTVSPALEAICLRAMARDPASRYASASDLAADVRRWMADEPVDVYADPWTVRLTRWGRRHRTLVASSLLTLVTLVAGLAVTAALVRREQRHTLAEKQVAEQQRDLARAEHRRAQRNYQISKDLAVRLLDISEQELPSVRQSNHVRKLLLEAALGTFRQFLAQQPDDQELRARTSRFYRYAANLQRQGREDESAVASYARSIELLERLRADFPDEASYTAQLAEALRDQSQELEAIGRLRDASTAIDRSVELTESLHARAPANPEVARLAAASLLDAGVLAHTLGQFDRARQLDERSLRLWETVLDRPAGLDPMLDAMTRSNLAASLRELGEPGRAIQVHDDALARFRTLLDQRATTDLLHSQSDALVEAARTALLIDDRRPSAERDLGMAIGNWANLQSQQPELALYRFHQAAALEVRGQLRLATGRPDDAEADFESARDTAQKLSDQFPQIPSYHGLLGRALGGLGRVALARGDRPRAIDRFEQATAAIDRALALAPDLHHAIETRRQLQADLDAARGLAAP